MSGTFCKNTLWKITFSKNTLWLKKAWWWWRLPWWLWRAHWWWWQPPWWWWRPPWWRWQRKGDQRLEIRKCDGPTNGLTNLLTWVGARDTCVSKKIETLYWMLNLVVVLNCQEKCDHFHVQGFTSLKGHSVVNWREWGFSWSDHCDHIALESKVPFSCWNWGPIDFRDQLILGSSLGLGHVRWSCWSHLLWVTRSL